MIEWLGFIIAGWLLGILSGLAPGLHLNTIATIIMALQVPANFLLVLLIVAMNVMHAFVDFIPSILLGAPDIETSLSTLPGHRLFLKGDALWGIELTAIGGLVGTLVALLLIPVYALFAAQTSGIWFETIPIVLAGLSFFLVLHEKTLRLKIIALLTLALAGGIGLVALQTNSNLLFALVSGFFGCSSLVFSLSKKNTPVPQKTTTQKPVKKKWLATAAVGSASSAMVSFFPALSASHAAFVCQSVLDRFSAPGFLVLQGAINTAATVFSFVALQTIGKARTGSAVAVQELYAISHAEFWLILSVILLSAGTAFFVSRQLAKIAVRQINRVPYEWLSVGTLFFLAVLVGVLGGWTGLFWMTVSCIAGLVPHATGVQKSHLMAFLIVPTVFFYWRL